MISGIIKFVILLVVLAVVSYLGLSVWSSCKGPSSDQPDMPDRTEASHEFYIVNTGGLILSSDYEQRGFTVGSRQYILHGFWEMRGKSFKYVEGDIILDETTFGKIDVGRRK